MRVLVSEAIEICDELGFTVAGNHMHLGLEELNEATTPVCLHELPEDLPLYQVVSPEAEVSASGDYHVVK